MEDKFYWIKHLSPKLIALPAYLIYMYDRPPESPFQWVCFGIITVALILNVVITWDGASKTAPSVGG